jgi:hypothetical protein
MILSEEQRIHIEILKNALEEKLADQGVLSLFGKKINHKNIKKIKKFTFFLFKIKNLLFNNFIGRG